MKTYLIGLLLMLTSFCAAWGQQKPDVIVRQNGEKIEGFVRQIRENDIYYGQPNMPEDVFRTISINDVAVILYHDGKVQTFAQPTSAPSAAPTPEPAPTQYVDNFATPAQPPASAPMDEGLLYMKGVGDAQTFYSRYTPAGTGTLIVSLLSPLAGLIPAIACSSTPPKVKNLGMPYSSYSTNPHYLMGYKAEAKKKKSRKVWKNFGIAFGINLGLALILRAK